MKEQRLEFERALLALDRLGARAIFERAGQARGPSDSAGDAAHSRRPELTDQLVVPALERIGAAWEQGEVALSQVYMSARICEDLVVGAAQRASRGISRTAPPMAIAVFEDHHLLGARIVKSLLMSSGYDLIDYGRMGLTELVDAVGRDRIRILLVSTLMLRSALRVKQLRAALDEAEPGVRLVVGGAPFRFDENLASAVGADAAGRTGADAVKIVGRLAAEGL